LHQLPDIPDEEGEPEKKPKKKKKPSGFEKPLSLFEARRLKGWWPCIAEMADGTKEMAVVCLFYIQN
jgi:hypothetical protein